MNRRDFIGAAAAAAVTAGCSPSSKGGKYVTADRLGVCSWSYKLPMDAVAAEMKKLGLVNINLALQPFLEGDERHGKAEDAAACKRAEARIASGEWKVSATMISFNHEDYSTLDTIRKTGGIVPDEHWEADRALVVRAAKLTGEWKVPYMLIIGENEKNSGTVTARARLEGEGGVFSVGDFIAKISGEIESKKH